MPYKKGVPTAVAIEPAKAKPPEAPSFLGLFSDEVRKGLVAGGAREELGGDEGDWPVPEERRGVEEGYWPVPEDLRPTPEGWRERLGLLLLYGSSYGLGGMS